MVSSNSPIVCEPPLPMGQVSSSNPLLSIHKHVSNIAAIFGLNCLAKARRSPRWSVCAWVRKIASKRATFFKASGHHGFVVTHGSIKATWPEGVVSENVLWPKYVMRLPLVLSMRNLRERFLVQPELFKSDRVVRC